MSAIVYIKDEPSAAHRTVKNGTGADVAQYEFGIFGPFAGVADEAIVNNASGSVHVEGGIKIQTNTLETGENTFGTLGQEVFWNPTSKKFSDTETSGYYLVGYLLTVKSSAGVIEFEKVRYAELVVT